MAMEWENVGVAPPYRDYRLAFKLSGPGETNSAIATDTTIKGWLPGAHEVSVALALPAELPPGTYGLALGVVEARTAKPAVQLAIEGRDEEGWYALSEIKVEAAH